MSMEVKSPFTCPNSATKGSNILSVSKVTIDSSSLTLGYVIWVLSGCRIWTIYIYLWCIRNVCKHMMVKIFSIKCLMHMGLRAFLDSEELELEGFLPRESEAMAMASLHIAILSYNHVQSCWCWADLSFMCKTCTRIVPNFYHVMAEDVLYAKRVYAAGFFQNEKRDKYTLEKLQEWKRMFYGFSHKMGDSVNSNEDEDRLQLKNIVSFVLKVIRMVAFAVAECDVEQRLMTRDLGRDIANQQSPYCSLLSRRGIAMYNGSQVNSPVKVIL
ncbi:hypothetical protein SUGI_0364530 [Cryptomeria japonica]|nr:hypothetical protein SUGI_0364530 [Cryptomeria japonica]